MITEPFVIARAGYNPKLKRDVSWDEIKRTFTLYKRIPMIVAAGDIHHNPIDPNLAVGHIDAKIYDDEQIVRGDPTWYREKFETVPSDIQQKLMKKEHIDASLGYTPFDNIKKIDHVLIGARDPVFKDIGFHAEESGFIYEETEGMNPEKEQPKEEAKEEVTTQPLIAFTQEQFKELLDTLKPPPAPQEPPKDTAEVPAVAEENVEPAPAQEEETQDEPPLVEPERVLPKSSTTKDDTGAIEDEFGRRYFSIPIAGRKEKEQKET